MPRGFWPRTVALAIVAIGSTFPPRAHGADTTPTTAPTAFPVVPGYEQLKAFGKTDASTMGTLLLGELNCTACHKAPDATSIAPKGGPDLSAIGARATPAWIRSYVTSPHAAKPGTTMPDLFHASEPAARDGAAEALTHYLVSLGGPLVVDPQETSAARERHGGELFHSVGCVACHAPQNNPATKIPSVPFPDLASKTTVKQLEEFLLNPLKARPASRMPNAGLSDDEARDIAIYLLRAQASNPQTASAPPARTPGLHYAYFEADGINSCANDVLDKLKPVSEGKSPFVGLNPIKKHRAENFGVRFTGVVAVPREGKYTFIVRSDDGARVFIDGKEIIDNDGTHPNAEKSYSIDLKAGDHELTVNYFQGGGQTDLALMWEGPGIKRGFIPPQAMFSLGGRPMMPLNYDAQFKVDPEKAKLGQQMFSMIGCANCHALQNENAGRPAKPLAAIDVSSDTGCLAEHVAKGLPLYELNADQKTAIKAALKDTAELAKQPDTHEQITLAMGAMNCYACHNRDGIGGPMPDRAELFVMSAPFDMGDEGRLPPKLTRVGAKLKQDAIEKIVFEGKLHVRPALATRMPIFNRERLAFLPEALAKADPATDPPAPEKVNEVVAKDGRTLVGNKGLGCVNCHGVGDMKSLGMPAPALTFESQRLRSGWFHELLANPPHVNPGTRMPAFWDKGEVAFPKLAGGKEETQIDAIWAYISLGTSMPLPPGLAPTGGFELIPTDEPIVHRTFMAEVGPRAVLVGFPENVHVAFDANVVRLAKAWRGRFFDAKGQWDGRGGQSLGPLGTDIINMPAGPAFAVLASPDAPWPLPKADERNLGGQFKGYVLDKEERPTFHYILDAVDVQEQPLPVLTTSGPLLDRRFTVSSGAPVKGLMFLAGAGDKIEAKSPGTWIVDGKLTLKVSPESLKPVVRTVDGKQQLIVPIDLEKGTASFDVLMDW